MSQDLPNLFFRTRENGAAVFRVDTTNRQGRLDLQQIAVANVRNGEIKSQGQDSPTPQELAQIKDWMDERVKLLEARNLEDIHRTVDFLNQTAQWVQSKASPEQLDMVTDTLLLAMHDLRSTLIRKRAEKFGKK